MAHLARTDGFFGSEQPCARATSAVTKNDPSSVINTTAL
jgi:hypothetical protein